MFFPFWWWWECSVWLERSDDLAGVFGPCVGNSGVCQAKQKLPRLPGLEVGSIGQYSSTPSFSLKHP